MRYEPHKISTWSVQDQPTEKLVQTGISTLSDAELLSIIIGSGTKNESALQLARRALFQSGNNLNRMAKMTVDELMEVNGIGKISASRILSAFALGTRREMMGTLHSPQINNSRNIFDQFAFMKDYSHEEFWIIYLNRSNRVITKEVISKGGTSGTVVDTRLILKKALNKLAHAVICVHNHPSGNKIPSEADKNITKKIKEACKAVDIGMLDHIIVTESDYYSFADEGMLI